MIFIPKGVMVEHGQLAAIRRAWADANRLRPGLIHLQMASVAFDVFTGDWVRALTYGGTLVLCPRETLVDGAALERLIRQTGVACAEFVPAVLNNLLTHLETQGGDLRFMETILCGSDTWTPESVARLRRLCAETTRIANTYGLTEATIDSSRYDIGPSPARSEGNLPIGRPIPNVRILILDEALQPVPIGVAGELHIGGAGVARGYLNSPELTAARFIDSPFHPGERLYRTGDLGRWRRDGAIEYLGRNDFQVKIRGNRVELGEIETTLAAIEGVREAVVVARECAAERMQLVGYVLSDEEIGAPRLRAHLARVLPDYMIPDAFVRLEAWPLTANGKLDRKGLPAPEAETPVADGNEAPRTWIEQVVAEVWLESLQVARVGIRDNFFALGGHSFLAIKMMSRLRERGLHASVQALFIAEDLAAFAAAVEVKKESASETAAIDVDASAPAGGSSVGRTVESGIPEGAKRVVPEMLDLVELNQAQIDLIAERIPGGMANIQDIYPLTPLQEGMLFHHLLAESGEDPYLISATLPFDSRDALDAYLRAMDAVISRHAILRTRFVWEDLDSPVQVVLRHATLDVVEVDIDADVDFEAGARPADLPAGLASACGPADIAELIRSVPMIGCRIARGADARWWLHLRSHHMLLDLASFQIVGEEIDRIRRGEGADLPRPTPFRNFVAQARQGVGEDEHRRFFTEMLGDVSETCDPFDASRLRADRARRDRVDDDRALRLLPPALCARIRRATAGLGVNVASLMHLAWAVVVSRVVDRQTVVFGTLLSGRMQAGADSGRMLGMLINTLPIRIEVGSDRVADALRKTHRDLALLMRHEHAPLVLALRCADVASSADLFTSVLNYRHAPPEEMPEAGDEARWLQNAGNTSYPLAVAIDDFGAALSIGALAPAQVGAARVCEYLHAALEEIVDALALDSAGTGLKTAGLKTAGLKTAGLEKTDSGKTLAEIDPMPRWERARLRDEWAGAALAPATEDICLHAHVTGLAARAPDAPAVVFGEETLTRRELEAFSNRVAHLLIGEGIAPGDLVALAFARGLPMIATILGVLKSGAAYLPLDPEAPSERTRAILRDAAPALLIADISEHLPETDAALSRLSLREAMPRIETLPVESPEVPGPWAQRAAYVIYTSGTSGLPKGVVVEHANLANFCRWCGDAGLVRDGGRMIMFAPYTFDASAGEMFTALCNGVCLHLLGEETIRNPDAFMAFLGAHAIDFAALPPAYLQQLDPAALGAGVTIMTAGSAPSPELIGQWSAVCAYHNGYGPTETTVISTIARMHPHSAETDIGRPIAHTRVYVLDSRQRLAPVGAVGEICIAGAGVARGYLNRPQLTAERFVDDPHAEGGRMYRTGDLGKWQPDGSLAFAGRRDFQFKIRGYRVEPGEIESRLTECPGVREALVMPRKDARGEVRIVAYCIAEDAVAVDALCAHARRTLPEYMVPAAYVKLKEWPLTRHGKPDRDALPAPEDAAHAVRGYRAPRTETERLLARIWSDLLGVERVGRDDRFFELGGHSLLAIRLVQRVNRISPHKIAVGDVFAAATLEALARRIDRGPDAEGGVSWTSEVVLDDGIRPAVFAGPSSRRKNVVLTGATGFVGRFLLRRLLDESDAVVYCLVRGADRADRADRAELAERLRASMLRWGLWRPEDANRIEVCPCDLAAPALGLSERDRVRIRDDAATFFHNGTRMNHLEPYASARPANVEGVRELLRMAADAAAATFNYVSTINVFSRLTPRPEAARVDETTPIEHEWHPHADGYSASKWVGEGLVGIARDRGLPCNVFRLGLVAGDSLLGRYDEKQGLHRLMRTCLLLNAGYADGHQSHAVLPVDHVAEAIVALADASRDGVYHLCADSGFSIDRLFAAYDRVAAAPIEIVPYGQWLEKIGAAYRAGNTLPIYPLLQPLIDSGEAGAEAEAGARDPADEGLRVECARTRERLAALGIVSPVVDDAMLERYWRAVMADR